MINTGMGNTGKINESQWVAIPLNDPKPETKKSAKAQTPKAVESVRVTPSAQNAIASILEANLTVGINEDVSHSYVRSAGSEGRLNFRPEANQSAVEAALDLVETKVALFHQNPPRAALN